MRRIRSKNTKWELDFRRLLWRRGLRYRVHYGPHKIDVAFPRQNVAVFLDSCFWHYCPEHRELPESNREFWRRKLEGTWERDSRVTRQLEEQGWTVVRLWSHDFVKHPEEAVSKVVAVLARR